MFDLENIKFDDKGLIPVVTQDEATGKVLMLAYANREALHKTIETGVAHYFSRSRQALWLKGKTSGNFQNIKNIAMDCDKDAILYVVKQEGFACHTGCFSCFDTKLSETDVDKKIQLFEWQSMDRLYHVIKNRKEEPKDGSYTNYLFAKGVDKILKKVGEETAEVIIAAKNKSHDELKYEIADLLYHLTVLVVNEGLSFSDILKEIQSRESESEIL